MFEIQAVHALGVRLAILTSRVAAIEARERSRQRNELAQFMGPILEALYPDGVPEGAYNNNQMVAAYVRHLRMQAKELAQRIHREAAIHRASDNPPAPGCAECERYVWNLAGCEVLANGQDPESKLDETLALPALRAVRDAMRAKRVIAADRDATRRQVNSLRSALELVRWHAVTAPGPVVALERIDRMLRDLGIKMGRPVETMTALEREREEEANGRTR